MFLCSIDQLQQQGMGLADQARQTGMGAFNQARQQGMGALGQVQSMGQQGLQQVWLKAFKINLSAFFNISSFIAQL